MAQQGNTQSGENRRIAGAESPPYRPLVSIVVPMFNAALTIERALRSIEAQSYPNWEAIFIDDASEDEGARYVAAAASRDLRIRLIRLDLNGGPARARNLGISACRGELVAFLDADDEWLPEKLARQVAPFGADTGLSLVVADMQVTDVAGAASSSVYARQAPVQGAEAWRTLLGSSFVATSVAVTRRDLLESVGGFDPDLIVGEDQDLFIRLALAGRVQALAEPLAVYHWMSHSYSTGHAARQARDVLGMVHRHLDRLADKLSRRERRDILARRYERLGRNLVDAGAWLAGMQLLLGAALSGRAPLHNLFLPLRRLMRPVRS